MDGNQRQVLILDGTRVDDVRVYDDEITPCLKNRMGTGGNNVPFIAFATNQRSEVRDIGDIAVGLAAEPGTNQRTYIVEETTNDMVIPIHDKATRYKGRRDNKQDGAGNGLGVGEETDPMYTLDTHGNHAIAYDEYNDSLGGNVHHAIRAGTKQSTGVVTEMQVRRLTPVECERLMGWPDNHTLHRADGKTNSDTTRYKMCGNGVASPVAQWIAEQINQHEQSH